MENKCIFCKIVKGEIPAEKIYEDEKFLAFLDIEPVSHGHTLIIPKHHVEWMHEADDETISEIFRKTKKLMLAMKKGLPCDYVQIGVVGKDIPHFHVHLIPRMLSEQVSERPTSKYKDGESKQVAKKIKSSVK